MFTTLKRTVFLTLVFLTFCANAQTSQKVAVYDLALLDTLNALHIPVAGVPGTTYPNASLPDVFKTYQGKNYAKIGSLKEPDIEALKTLKPDLILVGNRSASKKEVLSQYAKTLDISTPLTNITEGVIKNTRDIAILFNKTKTAESKINLLKNATNHLQKLTQGKGNALVVLISDGKISAFGPGTRFGIIHDDYGVAPAAPNLEKGKKGQIVNLEFITQTDPDWLFVIDRNIAISKNPCAKETLNNELIKKTKAYQKNHIIYLDPYDWYLIGGGLEAMQRKVENLTAIFSQ